MPIHILAPEVANQIAAGEVVERPASAVKELIENSLDAGATDIRVEVREGGRRLIRVQDDGCGIPAAEAALAFERHATSKLATADDLSHLSTLGFRGEALASIASVAQVALLTRARDEETGTLIRMAEGREIGREPRGGPPGTLVTVEHLFANVPARLKFLKQPATEAAHIQQIVTRYALAYPERRLSLVSDGKLVFQSTGSGKLYDVLVKVYGLEMAREMLAVESERRTTNDERRCSGHLFVLRPPSPARLAISVVTGYIGSPSLHRGNRGYITLFVNRRWFQDTSIAYSVIQAYHTMLPVGRYPVAVIFIEIAARGSGCQRASDQGRGALPGERRGFQRGAEGGAPDVDRSRADSAGWHWGRGRRRPCAGYGLARKRGAATDAVRRSIVVRAPRGPARRGPAPAFCIARAERSGVRRQGSGVRRSGRTAQNQLPASSFQPPASSHPPSLSPSSASSASSARLTSSRKGRTACT